jgi:hypothetical protein
MGQQSPGCAMVVDQNLARWASRLLVCPILQAVPAAVKAELSAEGA